MKHPDLSQAAHDNRTHWEAMAPRWKAWWGTYKPASQPVSDYLLQVSGVQPGARVLDLATGMGEPALSFARAVGIQGEVLAIDQSPQMIDWAREEAQLAGLNNVRFLVADVEQLEQPTTAPFDVLVSRWGLMFCVDPGATLRRLNAWLTEQGRFVAAVWSARAEVPMLDLASEVFWQVFGQDLRRAGPGPFSLCEPEMLTGLFEQAGFVVEKLEKVPVVLPFASAQAYLQDRCQLMAPLADALAVLSKAERQRYDAALEAAISPWKTSDGIQLVNQSLCLSADKR